MKLFSPAAERNQESIAAVLRSCLPSSGTVLEIASGTGQHAVYFAAQFPQLTWQPSDKDEEALSSIRSWVEGETPRLTNLKPPVALDVLCDPAPFGAVDVIFNCNMIHISPWNSCEKLFELAQTILVKEGIVFLYGPYVIKGIETAPSNLEFDGYLKLQNSEWGVRALADVKNAASRRALEFQRVIPMPANNYAVIFKK